MTCQCGKVRYFTRRAAKTEIRQMKRRVGRLNAYQCPTEPGCWHIGHLPAGVRRGIYSRDDLRKGTA